MASLSTLFNVYNLQPGDVIHVGAGTYTLPTTINLGAAASGVAGDPIIIEGAGASTIFQGLTTAAGRCRRSSRSTARTTSRWRIWR